MSRLKNKRILLSTTIIIALLLSMTNIFAASASASGPGTLTVGNSGTISITTNAPGGFFQGTITSNNPGVATVSSERLWAETGEDTNANPSQYITIKAISPGTATFTISLVGEDFSGAGFSLNIPITVNVQAAGGGNTGGGNSGGGNSGGGNSDGGNSGGGNSGGGVTGETYDPEIPLGETEEEKQVREEREKTEQLERDKRIPLIESIEIVSNDEKRNGKTLSSLTTKEEIFDYSYSLPILINKVSLKVNGIDDGVTLDFDKDHEVDGDKEIIIKASKGEISQEFKLKLSSQSLENLKVEDGFVYNDDELTKAFKDLGFELTEYELDGKKLSMFNKKDLNLQMIVNDNREALFYRLDEKGNVLDKGQLVVHEKEVLFVLAEAGEELHDKKLYGNGYSSIDLPKPTFLDDVDETLKVKQLAAGWEFEEGVIVLALDDTLDKDMYHIVSDKPFKAAVVAFDGQSSPVMVYALIASLVALLSVTVGFITYYLKSKKRIQILLSRN